MHAQGRFNRLLLPFHTMMLCTTVSQVVASRLLSPNDLSAAPVARPAPVSISGSGIVVASSAARVIEVAPDQSPAESRPARPSRVKQHILFHHVWKCGGSNFCAMAMRNGESVPNAEDDEANRCNLGASPRVFSHYSSSKRFTFAAWQQPLPKDVPLGSMKVAVITILRNPLDQALSHFRHTESVAGLWSGFEDFLDFGVCLAQFSGASPGDLNDWCQPYKGMDPFSYFEDNMQTRWLLGDGGDISRRKLGTASLAEAKKRLDSFDDVMILEQFHKRDAFRMAKYGWQDLDDGLMSNKTAGTNVHSNAAKFLASDQKLLAKLKSIQNFDLELYAYACKLAAKQAGGHAEAAQARSLRAMPHGLS